MSHHAMAAGATLTILSTSTVHDEKWTYYQSQGCGLRIIFLTNKARRKRSADQSLLIATMRTDSNPAAGTPTSMAMLVGVVQLFDEFFHSLRQ